MLEGIIDIPIRIEFRISCRDALYLKMDKIISKGIAFIMRQFAHLSEIYLIVVFETVENVLEVLRVTGYVKGYSYHCDQMMDL